MNQYRLGVAPINWTNDDDPRLGGDISFEQCIKEMSEAGYNGCEIGNRFPTCPQKLKQHLQPLGLEVSSAWYSCHFTEKLKSQNSLSDFMKKLSFLSTMGAKYINVCEVGGSIQGSNSAIFGDTKPIFTEKQWNALVQGLHQLGRLAYDYGMTLVYHHHLGTGIQTQQEIDRLMNSTCPDLISLLVDTGHCVVSNIDSTQLIKKYNKRIKYIHLKDIRNDTWQKLKKNEVSFMTCVRQGLFTVPGDGNIEFNPIFDALTSIDYRGWLIVEAEQDPTKANPKDYALSARRFIKKQIEEIK